MGLSALAGGGEDRLPSFRTTHYTETLLADQELAGAQLYAAVAPLPVTSSYALSSDNHQGSIIQGEARTPAQRQEARNLAQLKSEAAEAPRNAGPAGLPGRQLCGRHRLTAIPVSGTVSESSRPSSGLESLLPSSRIGPLCAVRESHLGPWDSATEACGRRDSYWTGPRIPAVSRP